MNENAPQKGYQSLIATISTTYTNGKVVALRAVNNQLLDTYWQIGQHIVAFEQGGKAKATYGKALLENLSKDLNLLHGRGFSLSNVKRFRQFYLTYPIFQTASGILKTNQVAIGAELTHQSQIIEKEQVRISAVATHQLSWTHYVELIKINDPLERSFYQQQTILENWSVEELIRQKKTSLYLRLAASKDKEGILKLAHQGQQIAAPTDILRETYIFEFLKIAEPYHLSETELEQRLITHLQTFLLELGKGFAFIGRQYRITLGDRHHYVDLVFYHRILKCFVLIDLKREEASYQDVGQMNMYLGYFENEENTESDNQPIGIVLAKEKDELVIQYAMHNVSSQLFVQKYQLYLPDKEELRKVIEDQLNNKDEI
ncbi:MULTISPECIES: PDDEXK nuclease domain-containing protein [unclassified Flavobacterium]|jgi:predicted nuclease of restriction endonuclease-like (RecB) superfamily|uniref:PDDEXK nuclease domain-containing protein n=1 Tax=unclassified Flavobacterium TaxID=196869 RepID=UPI0025BB9AA2|nr:MULTISPECIES: PDDEXK nuclease domain-containing protein [unclassified Flavobacterium]